MDLKKYSDEQLDQMEKQLLDQKVTKDISLSKYSDKDLDQMESQLMAQQKAESTKTEEPSLGRALQLGVEKAGTFGFRPAVAGAGGALGGFIGKLQAGGSLSEAAQQGKEFFFDAREEAKAEQEAAAKAHPVADFAGQAAGTVATLPLVAGKGIKAALATGGLFGAGDAASNAESLDEAANKIITGTATSALTYGALKGGGAVVRKVGQTPIGQKIAGKAASAVEKTKQIPSKVFDKIAHSLTGVDEKKINTFRRNVDEINRIIARAGGDWPEEANKFRETVMRDIQSTRKNLNAQITEALVDAPDTVRADINPIIDTLNNFKDKLSVNYDAAAMNQIDDIINKIKLEAGEDGLMTVSALFKTKQFLQERAAPSYSSDGKIFITADQSAKAAKQTAAVVRKALNKLSPEIAKANNTLELMHKIEDRMNRSLLKIDAPEAPIFAAGSGAINRNTKSLQKIGAITGKDYIPEVQKLAAAREFADPSWVPVDATGKSFTRLALGVGAGALSSGGTALGVVAGAALTSPAALKKAIEIGSIPPNVVRFALNKTGAKKLTDASILKLRDYLSTEEGQTLLINSLPAKDAYSAVQSRLNRGQ